MSTFPRDKNAAGAEVLGVEFDSGLNTSAAWTEHDRLSKHHHQQEASLSDEETTTAANVNGASAARSLYKFEGKPEFGELSLPAGVELRVLKEDVGDGWSLVDCKGQIGLFPKNYYTYTAIFARAARTSGSGSKSSITPRTSTYLASPLEQQSTGSYFPSFRESLLGGRSLNRFSNFVTSGAEDWVLNGATDADPDPNTEEEEEDERDAEESSPKSQRGSSKSSHIRHHFVDAGPEWRAKAPAFRIMVHSPYKCTSSLQGSFTMYQVTSIFDVPPTDNDSNTPSPTRVTVHRRFSHFVSLHTAITRRLPGIALSPLPGKQYTGRFSDDFVEARRGDLERYLARLVRHPIARYAEVLTFFLSCDNEAEWRRQMPKHLSLPPAGPAFYARVYHPSFNIDLEDALESGERFAQHVTALGKGVQWLRGVLGRLRAVRAEEATNLRILSYSLLGLITSTSPEDPGTLPNGFEHNVNGHLGNGHANGRSGGRANSDGAWCWREQCADCLGLTQAYQRTAEYLQHMADLYDNSAREKQLMLHEHIKDLAHPRELYQPVIETHQATAGRYKTALSAAKAGDEVPARCETVLNTTMAEFEIYHTQKQEDFRAIAVDYLDGEIELHEQMLSRLKAARANFEPEVMQRLASDGPRKPSIYEKDLSNRATVETLPILQPCPHVFDSVPMRPVSAAVHEGVGILFGSAATGRSSVFSRLW